MANLRIHCPVKGAALVNCMHTLQLPLSQLQNKRVNFLPSKLGRKTICTTLVKLDRRAADKFYGQPQAPAPSPAPAPAPARARWCVTKFTAEQLPPHRSATRLPPLRLAMLAASDSQTFTIYCTFAYKISPNSGHI